MSSPVRLRPHPPTPQDVALPPPVSLRFAAAARCLAELARSRGLIAPSFRSPPRLLGLRRTLRRSADGSVTVALVLRDRPWNAVVNDMIDGVVAANRLTEPQAGELRDLCWAAFETIELSSASAA